MESDREKERVREKRQMARQTNREVNLVGEKLAKRLKLLGF